jgi:hypothetical protein
MALLVIGTVTVLKVEEVWFALKVAVPDAVHSNLGMKRSLTVGILTTVRERGTV